MKFNPELTKFWEGIQFRVDLYSYLLKLPSLKQQFAQALALLLGAIENNKKILIFGNGGSAADASHFAAELVCQYQKKRRAIAAIALTTDPAILTAQSNDYEFETVFSRQIEALCQPGDVVIGLTTSDVEISDTGYGRHSRNILRAFKEAKAKQANILGFFSIKTCFLLPFVDVAVIVPHRDTAIIQEAHQMIIHELCKHIEEAL